MVPSFPKVNRDNTCELVDQTIQKVGSRFIAGLVARVASGKLKFYDVNW